MLSDNLSIPRLDRFFFLDLTSFSIIFSIKSRSAVPLELRLHPFCSSGSKLCPSRKLYTSFATIQVKSFQTSGRHVIGR